jgi:hypothetical protein
MNESITQPQHETKPAKSRRSTNLNDELNNPCLKVPKKLKIQGRSTKPTL